jgi:hypothetical protein
MDHTYVALLDVDHTGLIDTIVVYEALDGTLIRIVGTFELGPFGTTLEAVQWLTRTLRLDTIHSPA